MAARSLPLATLSSQLAQLADTLAVVGAVAELLEAPNGRRSRVGRLVAAWASARAICLLVRLAPRALAAAASPAAPAVLCLAIAKVGTRLGSLSGAPGQHTSAGGEEPIEATN